MSERTSEREPQEAIGTSSPGPDPSAAERLALALARVRRIRECSDRVARLERELEDLRVRIGQLAPTA